MRTINISLISEQFETIEKLTHRLGFANPSEFIRAVLRSILRKPEAVSEITALPFKSPDTTSRTEILASFRKTKKYSESFLKDLEAGLRESNYFKE